MNIFFFRLFGIDYKYVLNYDLIEIDKEEREKAAAKTPRRRRDGYTETLSSETNTTSMNMNVNVNVKTNATNDLELTEIASKNSNSPTKKTRSLSPSLIITTIGSSHDGMSMSSNSNSGINNGVNPISQLPIHTSAGTSSTSLSLSQSSAPSESLSFPQGDLGSSISWYKFVLFSAVLLFLLHFSTHYWMDHLHRSSIGAVAFFYSTMMLYIFVPIRQNEWLRRSFVIVVQRTCALIHPRCSCIRLIGTNQMPRRIPFVDVFYADAMCSLSKVFFDWGMLAHQAVHYPYPVPSATHNIVVPSLCAALPYLIRARQCLIMHRVGKLQRDPKRYQHMMNAFKYSTSMYPLILSAYLKTFPAEADTSSMERILVVLLVINASYSLYWDIVMDWGMMQDPYKVAQTACRMGVPSTLALMDGSAGHEHGKHAKRHTKATVVSKSMDSCHHLCLRPRLRYGLTLTALIVMADSFLRFSWMLKFVPRLFPSNDAFVLCTQFLEVFRRGIWNLLRVEWENIKQMKAKKAAQQSKALDSLSDVDGEEQDALLFDIDVDAHMNTNSMAGAVIAPAATPIIRLKEDPPEASLEMKILR